MKAAKVLITGGGIGGLTTALCLHGAGFEVEVYESASEIKPLGVGINLLPHAVRVLTHLGLQEQLAQVAVATAELVYYNKFGQKIWQEPRGRNAGYHWPQFSIHRGLFQLILLDAVKERIGSSCIHAGHHLQRCTSNRNSVEAVFINKKTGEQVATATADILVGADGIHSVVRNQFYPGEGAPKFSGILLHRGTTRAKSFLTGSSMIMAGSVDRKFVAYPIQSNIDDEGNQLINWIADLRVNAPGSVRVQDWNRRADKEKLLHAFNSWHFDWLDIPAIIQSAEAVYEFPMSDRDPLPRWSFDRVTLLGDAAHPMYPIGSNGASQAILDAECLANAIQEKENAPAALKHYEQIRLPATANIVLQNRQMGPERVMQMVEERAPHGFKQIDEVISQDELQTIIASYRKIAGFDKDELNKKG